MSYIVARMEKMKSQNLGGIQKHNQREFENHSNKDIDVSRSHLNYDVVNPSQINYRNKIMNIIEEQREGTKAIRKDAVLVNEWIITSDQKFFKDMDLEQTEKFFEAAAEFFEERYGKQNLAYGQVHLDETTPHMHLGVVPMRDGKLQAKNVFNRKELLAIQNDLPLFLEKKGFKVNRGEPNGRRKHLTVDEFKDMQTRMAEMAQIEAEREERVKILEKEKNGLERQISTSREYLKETHHSPRVVGKKRTETVNGQETAVYTVTESELVRLDAIRRGTNVILSENESLKAENERLKERVSVLEKAQEQMSTLLQTAQRHASKFAEGIFERAITYAKFFSKNDSFVEQEQNKMLGDIEESPAGVEDYKNWQQRKREFERRQSLER